MPHSRPATCHSFSPLGRASAASPGTVRRTPVTGASAGRRVSMTRMATKLAPGRLGFTSTLTSRSSIWRVSITDGAAWAGGANCGPRAGAPAASTAAAPRARVRSTASLRTARRALLGPAGRARPAGRESHGPRRDQQHGLEEHEPAVRAQEERIDVHHVPAEGEQTRDHESGDGGGEHRREAAQQARGGPPANRDRRSHHRPGPEARAAEVDGDHERGHEAECGRVCPERQSGRGGGRGDDRCARPGSGQRDSRTDAERQQRGRAAGAADSDDAQRAGGRDLDCDQGAGRRRPCPPPPPARAAGGRRRRARAGPASR